MTFEKIIEQRGEKKGEKKGFDKAMHKVAEKLLKEKTSLERITYITGLPLNELNVLKTHHKKNIH